MVGPVVLTLTDLVCISLAVRLGRYLTPYQTVDTPVLPIARGNSQSNKVGGVSLCPLHTVGHLASEAKRCAHSSPCTMAPGPTSLNTHPTPAGSRLPG